MKTKLLLLSFLVFALSACNLDSTFEDDHNFEEETWHMNDLISFDFESDSKPQDFEVKVRSSLHYPFYNLFIKAQLLDSTGNTLKEELLGFDLYDSKTGKPLGKGNSIFQLDVTAFPTLQLPYDGKYKMQLTHYMRVEELGGLLSVGVRVKDPEN